MQRSLKTGEGLWLACRAGVCEALTAVWDSGLRGEPACCSAFCATPARCNTTYRPTKSRMS